jgi:hypothetical protein
MNSLLTKSKNLVQDVFCLFLVKRQDFSLPTLDVRMLFQMKECKYYMVLGYNAVFKRVGSWNGYSERMSNELQLTSENWTPDIRKHSKTGCIFVRFISDWPSCF